MTAGIAQSTNTATGPVPSGTVNPLRIYGVPFSQPVRAVVWLMLYKGLPFQIIPTSPGSRNEGGTRHPAFLDKNPGGTIPTLEEPDSGFTLGESNAIMAYLCNAHGWSDVYPNDARARARVDWYLNYHHRNLREASVGLIAPKIRKDLNIPEAIQQSSRASFARALRVLDTGWLAKSRFLAAEHLTIADFAAYTEIGQLQAGYTNLFDFEPYPNVVRWLADMRDVHGHDRAHVALTVLGDLSVEPPPMDTIRQANIQGLAALEFNQP